jgi:chromosome segregation ATPase
MSAVSGDVKPLIDFVALKTTADRRLQSLVDNTFSKVVLVRDYQTALRVAKDNNLTCVTPDL